ncbi:acyltransferase [Saccharomonospora sp. CUA-673]|uniref:acyltransferase family protein n=1 Tax=Saccharomonospora sp. CUA-673 TaxID=1904969 RepID=UPI00095D1569|nr:acyltransferase [Saccharomonospora sp. CUA-673]OLT39537.1 acyltransferase [Saccharomonospora sp. CUA-673]
MPGEPVQPAPTRSPRHISWDAVRVLGILAVLAFHTTLLTPQTLPGYDMPPGPLQMDFPFGASLLIVVSGYFAAMTIGRKPPFRWWLRRLARLLPAFFVAVVVIFAVSILLYPEGFYRPSYTDLVGNLAMLPNLVDSVEYIDRAHWTVPVQVCGFTAIALLAWKGKVRGRTASLVMWAVLLVPLTLRYLFMGPGMVPPEWVSMVMDGTGLNRAHLLVAGVAIYRWSKHKMTFTELLLMQIAVLAAHTAHPPPGDSVVAFAVALVLISVAAYQPVWDARFLTNFARPIRWLAGISYGVYLMHYMIGSIVARHVADLGVPWFGWIPVYLATAVFAGWALTRLVEQPAFDLLNKGISALPSRSVGSGRARAER